MGAAIEVFEDSRTIEVGRDRFVPVKTTNDLLVLRSDVYDLGKDFVLDQVADDVPYVELDGEFYKLVGDFDKRFPEGAPSLQEADVAARSTGDWTFGHGVRVVGDVSLDGAAAAQRVAPGDRARRSGCRCAEPDCPGRPTTVERILDRGRARCPTSDQPLMDALGPARRRGRARADAAAGFDNSGDGRLRRASATTSPTRRRGHAGAPAGRRRDRRRPGRAARDVARHRRQDHDRRPGAAGLRRGRALRVDRPRRRRRCGSARRPTEGQHIRARRRGRRGG